MENCLTCEYGYPSEDLRTCFCSAYYVNVYVPLDSMECPAYAEKEGP